LTRNNQRNDRMLDFKSIYYYPLGKAHIHRNENYREIERYWGKRRFIPTSEQWGTEADDRTITIYLYYKISLAQNSAEAILQRYQKGVWMILSS